MRRSRALTSRWEIFIRGRDRHARQRLPAAPIAVRSERSENRGALLRIGDRGTDFRAQGKVLSAERFGPKDDTCRSAKVSLVRGRRRSRGRGVDERIQAARAPVPLRESDAISRRTTPRRWSRVAVPVRHHAATASAYGSRPRPVGVAAVPHPPRRANTSSREKDAGQRVPAGAWYPTA